MTGQPPDRLRVLVVSPGFPPVRGGVEEHVGQLVRGLSAAGHQVEVLTAARGLRSLRIELRGEVLVRTYPAWPLASMSVSPRLLLAALRRRASGPVVGGADLLHVHSYHAANAIAVFNRSFRGRVILTPHYHGGGHTPVARVLHRGYRLLGRGLFTAATAVICVSRAEREQVLAQVPGVSAAAVRVIPNGVATAALRSSDPFPGTPPTVLSVGRLEPYKGVERMIEAFADVADPAQLVIIGDGSQADLLRTRIERLGLGSRVKLLGGVDEATLHRWLRTAWVLVSLSDHEAFGLAPLEAAAAGCRVVLSDIAAHREITHDYLAGLALLIDPADRSAITAAIEQQVRAPGPGPAPVPSWSDVTAETVEVYRGVLTSLTSRTTVRPGSARSRDMSVGTSSGQRIDPLDLPWTRSWEAIVGGPLETRPLTEIHDVVENFFRTHPRHPLACRLDAGSARWIPVPPEQRRAYIESIIRAIDHVDIGQIPAEWERHRPALDSTSPMTAMISPDGIVLYLSHAVGDGATLSETALALVLADPDRLLALVPRAVLRDAVGGLIRQRRSTYLAWILRAVRPGPAVGSSAEANPATAVARRAPQPDIAVGVLTNAEIRAIIRWRNEQCPGVSITAVMASRICLGLAAAGLPMRCSGFYSLFDIRSNLAVDGPAFGNLGKSVFLTAEMADPAAVDLAIRETLTTRRPLPALVAGAVLTRWDWIRARGQGRAGRDGLVDASDGPITLSFSSMPNLPGLSHLPWADGPRRYSGFGYPTSPDGVSVSAVRFRDRMEVSVTFDRSRVDPSQARAGIAAIAVQPAG